MSQLLEVWMVPCPSEESQWENEWLSQNSQISYTFVDVCDLETKFPSYFAVWERCLESAIESWVTSIRWRDCAGQAYQQSLGGTDAVALYDIKSLPTYPPNLWSETLKERFQSPPRTDSGREKKNLVLLNIVLPLHYHVSILITSRNLSNGSHFMCWFPLMILSNIVLAVDTWAYVTSIRLLNPESETEELE